MPLNASKAQTEAGKAIPPIEDGTYAARLVRVVDLGVQVNPFDSEKRANEIVVTFELMDEFLTNEDGNEDPEKPRVMSTFVKLYRNADRGKNVEYLRALDPSGQAEGDWGRLQEQRAGVLLNIITKEKNGKVHNNIDSMSPLMKGMSLRDCIVEGYVFDLDEPDREVFEALPDWIKEKIESRERGDNLAPTTYGTTEAQSMSAQAAEEEVGSTPAGSNDVPW